MANTESASMFDLESLHSEITCILNVQNVNKFEYCLKVISFQLAI